MTKGYNTGFDHILHVAGPVYSSSNPGESQRLLEATYTNLIRAADQLQTVQALGSASISTGIYGYPLEDAAPVAIASVARELAKAQHLREVVFAMFGQREYEMFSSAFERWRRQHGKDL